MKRKVLFIINPVSGGKKKDQVPGLIEEHLDSKLFDAEILFSKDVGHATRLAKEAEGYDMVVAVGGDGTVNEVATGLVGTDKVMGIIPCGSGNGLARFLCIPMDITKAIIALNTAKIEAIDAATLNGQWFFNMAGLGFDAHIAEIFSHDTARGFWTYAKSALKEFLQYKPEQYTIHIDDVAYEREAFMLSFANSSQYGNNAHVSPHASVQDGLIDVCVIKPIPVARFPEMVLRMFGKTADKSKYVEIIRGRHIVVDVKKRSAVHLDGEPRTVKTKVDIQVQPGVLKMMVGDKYSK